MTAKNEAKEIYFSMINAGKGLISNFLAYTMARICILNLIQDSKNTGNLKREKFWGRALFALIEIYNSPEK